MVERSEEQRGLTARYLGSIGLASPFELHPQTSELRQLLDVVVAHLPLPNDGPRPSVDLLVYIPSAEEAALLGRRPVPFGAHARCLAPDLHHYSIALVDDSIRRLRDTFSRMLASPTCFPSIGDPSLECEPTAPPAKI